MKPFSLERRTARFWSYAIPEPNSGCWLWIRAASPLGYGRFKWDVRTENAPRVAFRLTHGEIPIGLNVLHRCDTPACINPDHLFVGTDKDNVDDMRRKGRATWGQYQRQRTHCKHGHEFTRGNTYIRVDGARSCRACHRAIDQRRRAG